MKVKKYDIYGINHSKFNAINRSEFYDVCEYRLAEGEEERDEIVKKFSEKYDHVDVSENLDDDLWGTVDGTEDGVRREEMI